MHGCKNILISLNNLEMFCIASIAMFTRTSNFVERLFSRAKPTLDDQSKRVLPMHFEQQVFLFTK